MKILDKFIDYKQKEGLSTNTLKAYKSDISNCLNKISKFKNREINMSLIKQITKQDILHLREKIKEQHQVSSTAKRCFNSFSSFLSYHVDVEGAIKDNYAIGVRLGKSKVSRKESEPFTELQCNKMLVNSKRPEDKMIIQFGFKCGLRAEEILNLETKDIDFQLKTVTVRPENAKSGRGRVVPIPFVDELLNYFKLKSIKGNKKIFKVPYRTWVDRFKKICKDSDIKYGSKYGLTFHSTRHSYIRSLIKAGADKKTIQELVGHSDFTITERYYQHVSLEDKFEAVKGVF